MVATNYKLTMVSTRLRADILCLPFHYFQLSVLGCRALSIKNSHSELNPSVDQMKQILWPITAECFHGICSKSPCNVDWRLTLHRACYFSIEPSHYSDWTRDSFMYGTPVALSNSRTNGSLCNIWRGTITSEVKTGRRQLRQHEDVGAR